MRINHTLRRLFGPKTVAEYERQMAYARGEIETRGCTSCMSTWWAEPDEPMKCPNCGNTHTGTPTP